MIKNILTFFYLGCANTTEFACMETGRCIEKRFRCDEDPDCSYDHPDSSDEKDCGNGDIKLPKL